jgi:hypothetical protein
MCSVEHLADCRSIASKPLRRQERGSWAWITERARLATIQADLGSAGGVLEGPGIGLRFTGTRVSAVTRPARGLQPGPRVAGTALQSDTRGLGPLQSDLTVITNPCVHRRSLSLQRRNAAQSDVVEDAVSAQRAKIGWGQPTLQCIARRELRGEDVNRPDHEPRLKRGLTVSRRIVYRWKRYSLTPVNDLPVSLGAIAPVMRTQRLLRSVRPKPRRDVSRLSPKHEPDPG